jgi:hypothetical protein
MASPAQIFANRDNARKSSGPKTIEGKQASSRNATRHGLTGAQIVMPGEDATAYEELCRGLHQSHKPGNEAERLLVDQIAANAWRLLRAQRIEAAVLAKLVEDSDNPDDALATAFLERPADLTRIQRYVTAAQNAYYKAMSQLAKLQKERAAAEYEAAMVASMRSSEPRPAIGFVSQTDPACLSGYPCEPEGTTKSEKTQFDPPVAA